ncbi:MAG: hypothetical protein G3M70_10325 [Candidatus Nitronauta litoralis]|uniref:Rieske domain-containing protein n=1 Tax=Candidatus Nitronauta litoralis TaxID=2705533 RepID=A0A7T0BWL0_9BACT|nr:MAG: hypothetical protein G3M70_10325 [Candidatus Nitronauta litoralis]
MSEVKLLDSNDLPVEGEAKYVELIHPLTEYPYPLSIYFAKNRYFVVTDTCKECGASLAAGKINGLFVTCSGQEHPWNFKTGLLKYDRTNSMPVYRVLLRDDGIYIEI